jgi:putative transposase
MLLQGDIKYGPYLPIGKNGAKKQVSLSAFIDDATRYIVAAKFYENQQVAIIADARRTAVMQYHFLYPLWQKNRSLVSVAAAGQNFRSA